MGRKNKTEKVNNWPIKVGHSYTCFVCSAGETTEPQGPWNIKQLTIGLCHLNKKNSPFCHLTYPFFFLKMAFVSVMCRQKQWWKTFKISYIRMNITFFRHAEESNKKKVAASFFFCSKGNLCRLINKNINIWNERDVQLIW